MMTSCKYTCQMKMLIRLCWSITCLLYMQVTLVTQTIVLILYKVCVYSCVKTLNVMSMIFNYLTASQQFQYYSDTDDDWDHQLIPYSNIVIIISRYHNYFIQPRTPFLRAYYFQTFLKVLVLWMRMISSPFAAWDYWLRGFPKLERPSDELG